MKILSIVILVSMNLNCDAHGSEIKKEPFKNGVYIIDGDTPVYDLDLVDKVKTLKPSPQKLIVNMLIGNVLDLWNMKGAQKLSYCIANSFEANKGRIVSAMEVATRDWMENANVQFIYLPDQDIRCDEENDMVVFDIRPVNVGFYLARAFFPSTPRSKRNILVDKSSFKFKTVTLEGIMRHELGHVLGFRHEHTHPDSSNICFEDSNIKPLTDYDKKSVMHYPQCDGETNLLDLVLSESDKFGAALAYPF